jgi:hypothetical protein
MWKSRLVALIALGSSMALVWNNLQVLLIWGRLFSFQLSS